MVVLNGCNNGGDDMGLTLRQTKGTNLSFAELDTNFTYLETSIQNLEDELPQGSVLDIRDYGAVNGTDCTTAFTSAATLAITTGKPIFVPSGTWIIDPAVGVDVVLVNQNITIYGVGPSSIIKRKDTAVTTDYMNLFRINGSGNIYIKDITINSNATNNPLVSYTTTATAGQTLFTMPWTYPTNGSMMVYVNGVLQTITTDYVETSTTKITFTSGLSAGDTALFINMYGDQHSADFTIYGSSDGALEVVQIENITWVDNRTDGFYFPNAGTPTSAGVQTLILRGLKSTDRTLYQNGEISITGGIWNVFWSDCDIQRVDYEWNQEYTDHVSKTFISNISVNGQFDLGGRTGTDTPLEVHAEGMTVYGLTLNNVKGSISGSVLKINDEGTYGRILYCKGLNIVDSTILVPASGGVIHYVYPYWGTEDVEGMNLTFRGCDIVIDADDATMTGAVINTASASEDTKTNQPLLVIEDCTIDARGEYSVDVYRGGKAILRNNTYGGSIGAIRLGHSAGYYGSAEIIGGTFNGAGVPIVFAAILGTGEILLGGDWPGGLNGNYSSTAGSYYSSRRWNSATTPTGGGLVGDTVKLDTPVANGPSSWICTTAHPTAATWTPAGYARYLVEGSVSASDNTNIAHTLTAAPNIVSFTGSLVNTIPYVRSVGAANVILGVFNRADGTANTTAQTIYYRFSR